MELPLFIWYTSLLILVIYYQVIFLPRQRKKATSPEISREGVSIIIAVKNGVDGLSKNIHAIINQEYTVFEVIIVNDHSTDLETSKLDVMKNESPRIRLLHSDQPPGKKHALMQGVHHAQYPLLLLTDADCRPVSQHWISKMVENSSTSSISSSPSSAFLLGYSPYEKKPGLLNLLIRFDTIITAMQYMSWAMLNRPYMGVGRNMLISKQAFLQLNPYASNIDIPYGDDDALIQAARRKYSIDICVDPDSFVISQPHVTWKGWWRQKHRHLSGGFSYSKNTWWQTGLFSLALILHWTGALILVMIHPDPLWISAGLIGLALRWILYAGWTKQLRDADTVRYFPLLELLYALYLARTGLMTLVSKRRTWN